jgi:NAD(P)-dependent dehydrogenase (short-subunit alcohol dehydrogenase family)
MELVGRRAVVTGGAAGLGEFIVRALAQEGAHVVVVDVDGPAATALAAELGGTALTADLSGVSGVDAVVAATNERIDILVNCAGGWSPKGRNYPESGSADWDSVLGLNLRAPMLLLQRLREPLGRSSVGACVSIASSAGIGEGAYPAPEYAVAKAGLIRLTTSLADWPGRYGVRVACVVPGWIGLPRALAQIEQLPAADRPLTVPPEDIATEVVRLIKDPGSGGQVVVMAEGEPPRRLYGE